MRKLTQDEFIARARQVHVDKYDYSKVVYVGSKKQVDIICPIHGVFKQIPYSHLSGEGCRSCSNQLSSLRQKNIPQKNNRQLIEGYGTNDYDGAINDEPQTKLAYVLWRGMIVRSYSKRYQQNRQSYVGCSVCDEWLYFSNFKRWFDDPTNGYQNGYCLDKDILVKGNKVYYPETCCFVPKEINSLIVKNTSDRGDLPIGVYKKGDGFAAQLSCCDMGTRKNVYLGKYNSQNAAFIAYKKAKEERIKSLAQTYYNNKKITEKVYNALMNYQVNIND